MVIILLAAQCGSPTAVPDTAAIDAAKATAEAAEARAATAEAMLASADAEKATPEGPIEIVVWAEGNTVDTMTSDPTAQAGTVYILPSSLRKNIPV